ncbi:MAG: GTPase, partial [Candidatus Saccharicenans sp.]|nr:GTPase [Candidatus Saccharicenans sp.]
MKIKNLPEVVIIGYPNVGKSTLFNRIIGQRKALIHSLPGMTRDLITGVARVNNREFLMVDTGGLAIDQADQVSLRIIEKAREATHSAEILVFMVDGKRALSAGEKDLYLKLKKLNKPLLVVVNKI